MYQINRFLVVFFLSAFAVNAQNDVRKEFFGMWAIEIEDGSVGWLNINDDNGYMDAKLLWQAGSPFEVASIYFVDDYTLVVTRPTNVRRDENRTHVFTRTFTIKRTGNNLTGTAVIPPYFEGRNVTTSTFVGWRLPDPSPAPDLSQIKYGTPVNLFNGTDLNGWRLINPNTLNPFKVVNGELVSEPDRTEGQTVGFGNIRTESEFEDFKLTFEVNIPEGSNSGVFLRGMYEVQIIDSYGSELDSHNMGALYGYIAPSVSAEKKTGEWQTMEIILCKRHVTSILNGIKIIDNQPVYGPTGDALHADPFKSGPIILQGNMRKVSFRNIVLTPIL